MADGIKLFPEFMGLKHNWQNVGTLGIHLDTPLLNSLSKYKCNVKTRYIKCFLTWRSDLMLDDKILYCRNIMDERTLFITHVILAKLSVTELICRC